jgi:glycosyltransferase involved in cell wall biosynthesis
LHATVLRSTGYEIETLCWDRGWDERTGDRFRTEYVSVPGGRRTFGNLLVLPLVSLLLFVRGHRASHDVIYCPHVLLLPAAAALSLTTGSALVYDVQELFLTDYRNRESVAGRALGRVLAVVERICLLAVDGVLTIDSADDAVRDRYARRLENVETVYNVPEVKPVDDDRDDGQVRVIFVGTIVEHRGVVVLAEALSHLSTDAPIQLQYVGPVRDDSAEQVQRITARDGTTDRVEFVGEVDYEEVHECLLAADIGVAPYQRLAKFEASRGNARKVFDYMNAALPVIVPDFGGLATLVCDLDCGITVDTTDPAVIAAGIERLAENPDERWRLGRNGREAVVDRYNWERESEVVIDVVRNARRDAT